MEQFSPTLKQVLVTTMELAAEMGCQQTTLQKIIRRTGISKKAIYHYVQSKDELFGLILKGHITMKVKEHHLEGARTTSSAGQPGEGLSGFVVLGPLLGIVNGLLRPANQHQMVLRRCFIYLLSRQEQPDVGQILDDLHHSWVLFITQWIERNQASGDMKAHIHAANTAKLIVSLLFGLMVQKSITDKDGESGKYGLEPELVLRSIGCFLELDLA